VPTYPPAVPRLTAKKAASAVRGGDAGSGFGFGVLCRVLGAGRGWRGCCAEEAWVWVGGEETRREGEV